MPAEATGRMSSAPSRAFRIVSPRVAAWLFHLALPLVGLWLLLANPTADLVWEDHTAHFWLILLVAGVNVALAIFIGQAALSRRDERLFLVSLAFASAAGFFALHAFVTPSVVLAT